MALTEGKHAGEFLVSEAPGGRSRENITIKAGADLSAGDVLGKIRTAGLTAAKAIGNAANTGEIQAGTLVKGANCQAGVYTATCVLAAANGGQFVVKDPVGKVIGTAYVGVAFLTDEIGFTIPDGATDFSVGESHTITVAATDAGKYALIDPEGTTGTQFAKAILVDAVPAALADKTGVAIVRDAVVNEDELGYSDADAGEIATIKAQLASVGIIARASV